MCVSFVCACSEAGGDAVAVGLAPEVEAYISLLDDASAAMANASRLDAVAALGYISEWCGANVSRARAVVASLVALPADVRTSDASADGVRQALDRYGAAQKSLRDRFDDSQNWELGEILARIK